MELQLSIGQILFWDLACWSNYHWGHIKAWLKCRCSQKYGFIFILQQNTGQFNNEFRRRCKVKWMDISWREIIIVEYKCNKHLSGWSVLLITPRWENLQTVLLGTVSKLPLRIEYSYLAFHFLTSSCPCPWSWVWNKTEIKQCIEK